MLSSRFSSVYLFISMNLLKLISSLFKLISSLLISLICNAFFLRVSLKLIWWLNRFVYWFHALGLDLHNFSWRISSFRLVFTIFNYTDCHSDRLSSLPFSHLLQTYCSVCHLTLGSIFTVFLCIFRLFLVLFCQYLDYDCSW